MFFQVPMSVANNMSLFFAHATPMLQSVSGATSRYVVDSKVEVKHIYRGQSARRPPPPPASVFRAYIVLKSLEGLKAFLGSIVGCRGASQLGGSLRGIPPGYKANKL